MTLHPILERDRRRIGPKLNDPCDAPRFDIGRRRPHCYSGMLEFPGQRAEQRFIPKMIERMATTAPPGADLSWRY